MTKLNKSLMIAAAAASLMASPAFAADLVNLSGTDYVQSSVTQNFAAGDYVVSFADNGLYKAWAPAFDFANLTANGNWEDRYSVTINGVTTEFNPFGGARFATADAAYDAFKNLTSSFSLSAATDVTFSIPDFPDSFWDNSGGVSLNVAAVPEPATWAMLVLGFFGMGTALRTQPKRQRQTATA